MAAISKRKARCSWQASGPLLSDKVHGNYWRSDVIRMFGFEWCFEFRPNCNNDGFAVLTLHLHSMPPNVLRIFIKQHDVLKETNTVCERTSYYDRDHMVWGWNRGSLKTESVQHLSHLTFCTEISLISCFSVSGTDMTHRYGHYNTTTMSMHSDDINMDRMKCRVLMNDDGEESEDEFATESDDSLHRLDSMAIQVSEIMDSIKTMQNTLKEIRTTISNDRQKATHVIHGQFFK